MNERRNEGGAERVEFARRGGGYALRFDYDEFLVALIKKLPKNERQWFPEKRYWMTTIPGAEFLAYVASRLGYTVTGIDEVVESVVPDG
jgi:hypothetical protein